jgi:hypothetical protein
MTSRLTVCIALSVLIFGLASAQAGTGAAAKNTWLVAGGFGMNYTLPVDEGEYTEEGALALGIHPLALWFPIDGLGVGVDAGFVMSDLDPGASETGWRLKLGLGLTPVVGGHVAVPVEVGYMTERLTSEYGEEGTVTVTTSRIYLESGLGAFLWKK